MFNNHFTQNLKCLPNTIELETFFLLLAMNANILYVIVKNYFLLCLMRQQRVSCQYIWVFFEENNKGILAYGTPP
jgi:hypothetical protein